MDDLDDTLMTLPPVGFYALVLENLKTRNSDDGSMLAMANEQLWALEVWALTLGRLGVNDGGNEIREQVNTLECAMADAMLEWIGAHFSQPTAEA